MKVIRIKKEKVVIFDTTLRDGLQLTQASLSLEDKVEIEETLDYLGVDYIEAGFPMTSEYEFLKVKAVADSVKSQLL